MLCRESLAHAEYEKFSERRRQELTDEKSDFDHFVEATRKLEKSDKD